MTAPLLAYPTFGSEAEFILETDVSGVGLGAVLSQVKEDGLVHPIAYASRSLNHSERNYAIIELRHWWWYGQLGIFTCIYWGTT